MKPRALTLIAATTGFALLISLGLAAQQQKEPTVTYTVLYTFTGGPADGGPGPRLAFGDAAGNGYGTTGGGGAAGWGTVFKLDSRGRETAHYSFTGGADGGLPGSPVGLVRDSAGNLYGTTIYGGAGGCEQYGNPTCGVVFKVNPSGTETVLHAFAGSVDGGNPIGHLVRDAAGNLYGTTIFGGGFHSGVGVVFKLDPTGKETVLYKFTGGNDGGNPHGGVTGDAVGNLYGTTLSGGASGNGVVFKVDPTSKETVLYSFTGGTDGRFCEATLTRDTAENLYGTTLYGGASGNGVVFKVDLTGKETVLHSFSGGTDGANPSPGRLIRDAAGNLYGTTEYGGASDNGVVYKLDPTGKETVLYSFTGGADGGLPADGLIRDKAGNLYGTTFQGGDLSCNPPTGCGTVFKISR
jgi:uncharacterized repeat protein (TIGR03803 family)